MATKYKAFLIALIGSLGLDQATKIWARQVLKPRYPEVMTVIQGYWDFRYSENPGSAFGLFRGVPGASYLLFAVGIVALVVVGTYLRKAAPDGKRVAIELGLLAGGALGNIVDRILYSRVTDFVVWKVGVHEWPTFNIADAALVVGVIGLLLDPAAPGEEVKPILFGFDLPLFGRVDFPAYFTLLTLGFGMAMILTVRESKKLGQDRELILDTNLWMVIWGIIGSRVLHLVADGHMHDYINLCLSPKLVPAIDAHVSYCSTDAQCFPEDTFLGFKLGFPYLCDMATHVCHPARDCLAAVKVWRGGLAYYGGFIFAVAFAYYFVRKHKLGWWKTADLASPGIMLGLFFGRLGCFLNGCCYGKQTPSWVGVSFPRGGSAWRAQFDAHLISAGSQSLPVHPTQLYESAACFVIFLVLYFVVRPRRRAFGDVFAWMLILYAIARSLCEIFRDDDRGVLFGFLSTSQIISIPLFIGGLALLVYSRRRKAGASVEPCDTAPSSS